MEHSSSEASASCGLEQTEMVLSGENDLTKLLVEEQLSMESADHVKLNMNPTQGSPNLIWREKVAQWCYEVVDHLCESRDVVYMAMNILDRWSIISFSSLTTERDYETAALTALFMAIRIAGSKVLSAPDLMRMSRLGISVREIVDVGKRMTKALSWNRRLVTPVEFVHAFASELQDDQKQELSTMASFLCELSVCDSFFTSVRAPHVAVAALLASCNVTPLDKGKSHCLSALLNKISRSTEIQVHSHGIICLKIRLLQLYGQCDKDYTDTETNILTSSPHIIPEDDEIVASDFHHSPLRHVREIDLTRSSLKRAVSPSILQTENKRRRCTA